MADIPFQLDHPNVIELTPDTGADLPGYEPIYVEREQAGGIPGRDRLGYLIGADDDGNWAGPPEHTGADAVTVTVRHRYEPGRGLIPTSYEVLYWKQTESADPTVRQVNQTIRDAQARLAAAEGGAVSGS